ncbi:Major Facilitator Superfamily protein [Rhodovulum sp. ES.010]|uniref:MFS transporter n=1 Tax=Rhodovulum sp. ES.010 TaxID=1882821 RepID=UPI00092C2F4D|nr:MFS transporter [Rhodovulum sp. ES.010]SIO49512.1 Major Facilitator Superfamily protein [Rhodovulum sp. ES.010]
MPFWHFLRENRAWLAAGALLTFTSSYGQTFFIAIFAGEIRAEFGLSHAAWGGIYTLGTAVSALLMVWAGALTDRWRVRSLAIAVLGLLALACIAMATVSAVWALPLVILGLRLFGQGITSQLAMVAMARWFVRNRGRALSIAILGVQAGQAVLPVVFVALMQVMPWRTLWLLAAGLVLAALPVLLLLLRQERTPQYHAETTQSEGMDGRHWRRGEVVRHWLFWLVVPAVAGPPAFGTALFFQQVHLAEIKGWPLVDLVALFPLFTAISVLAMLIAGWAIDRVGTARLMPGALLPVAVGFALMAGADSLTGAALAFGFSALSIGAFTTLPSAFWAEFYGTRNLGAIKALGAAVMVLGTALGPGLTGALIDLGIGFEAQLLGMSVYFALSAALLATGVSRAARLLPRTS